MKRNLEFEVFPGPDGKGTCCEDVSEGKICAFLRTVKMGMVDICNYTDEQVSRRDRGVGFTIPAKSCPFWGEKK